jgi:predicted dinucleotide-binding enzyme
MDITIIGTGNMARGIATRALAGGNTVTLLGTAAAKAEALAGELSGGVRTGTVGDPISSDIVVLAVWYQALDDVLARYGDQLAGKTIVDITNPVDPQTYRTRSGGRRLIGGRWVSQGPDGTIDGAGWPWRAAAAARIR